MMNEEEFELEEEFDYIAQTKPLGKLIFLVAFTTIMLISSTYAWFSAQKNVSINGIEGTVNVAEGLMISLDAKNWSQEIDLKNPVLDTGNTLDVPYSASADGTSYTAGKNNRPIEMLPVSATGVEDIGVNKEMSFYEGTNINGTELYGIKKTKAHVSESTVGSADEQYAGFFAIDLFLQNSSKVTESEQGTAKETLQLNTNSLLKLISSGSAETTGLQNTARVALAMYDTTGLTNNASTVGTDTSSIYVTANQSQILTAYEGKKISDIAIWEPNASTHVENIVTNNNTLKLNTTDDALYTVTTADATTKISKFTGTEVVPTYALTATSLNAVQELRDYDATTNVDKKGILDIYNWNITDANSDKRDDATGLSKQVALQTDTETGYTIQEGGVRNLVSVTSPGTTIYEMGNESGVIKFEMLKNSIIKLRMYVWLEGQDVDCTNYASHGGGVRVDLGLVKGAEVGSQGASSSNDDQYPYIPFGFSHVAETSLSNGYTVQDSAGNQYVWIEVPQTTEVYATAGLDLKNFTTDEYTAIEDDLWTYVGISASTGWREVDSWSSEEALGLTETGYYNLKNKMLKSIYQNGGFYIGKYEAGTTTVRASKNDVLTTPVIEQNMYPYNYVTCKQAQTLASGMNSGEYTSSLMFFLQFKLTVKHLRKNGVSAEIINNDSSWGNTIETTYNITNPEAKYNVLSYDTDKEADEEEEKYSYDPQNWLNSPYNKTETTAVMLTTGASEEFCKMGIYDLLGNMSEWLLANITNLTDMSTPNVTVGGSFDLQTYSTFMKYRGCSTESARRSGGFRVVIY